MSNCIEEDDFFSSLRFTSRNLKKPPVLSVSCCLKHIWPEVVPPPDGAVLAVFSRRAQRAGTQGPHWAASLRVVPTSTTTGVPWSLVSVPLGICLSTRCTGAKCTRTHPPARCLTVAASCKKLWATESTQKSDKAADSASVLLDAPQRVMWLTGALCQTSGLKRKSLLFHARWYSTVIPNVTEF